MTVAAVEVHLGRGLWSDAGGYEYNLVLIAVLTAVGVMGVRAYGLDRSLHLELPRPASFLGAVGLALVAVGIGLAGLL